MGHVGAEGELEHPEVVLLNPRRQQGEAFVFEREFTPGATGRLGVAMRVGPNHSDNPLNSPCNTLLTWAQGSAHRPR